MIVEITINWLPQFRKSIVLETELTKKMFILTIIFYSVGPDQLKSVLSIEVVDTTHDGVYVCVVNTSYDKLTADLLLLLEKGE